MVRWMGEEKMFDCSHPECGAEFREKWQLQRHVSVHQPDFECPYGPRCSRKFRTPRQLILHVKHHVERGDRVLAHVFQVDGGAGNVLCISPYCLGAFATEELMLQHYYALCRYNEPQENDWEVELPAGQLPLVSRVMRSAQGTPVSRTPSSLRYSPYGYPDAGAGYIGHAAPAHGPPLAHARARASPMPSMARTPQGVQHAGARAFTPVGTAPGYRSATPYSTAAYPYDSRGEPSFPVLTHPAMRNPPSRLGRSTPGGVPAHMGRSSRAESLDDGYFPSVGPKPAGAMWTAQPHSDPEDDEDMSRPAPPCTLPCCAGPNPQGPPQAYGQAAYKPQRGPARMAAAYRNGSGRDYVSDSEASADEQSPALLAVDPPSSHGRSVLLQHAAQRVHPALGPPSLAQAPALVGPVANNRPERARIHPACGPPSLGQTPSRADNNFIHRAPESARVSPTRGPAPRGQTPTASQAGAEHGPSTAAPGDDDLSPQRSQPAFQGTPANDAGPLALGMFRSQDTPREAGGPRDIASDSEESGGEEEALPARGQALSGATRGDAAVDQSQTSTQHLSGTEDVPCAQPQTRQRADSFNDTQHSVDLLDSAEVVHAEADHAHVRINSQGYFVAAIQPGYSSGLSSDASQSQPQTQTQSQRWQATAQILSDTEETQREDREPGHEVLTANSSQEDASDADSAPPSPVVLDSYAQDAPPTPVVLEDDDTELSRIPETQFSPRQPAQAVALSDGTAGTQGRSRSLDGDEEAHGGAESEQDSRGGSGPAASAPHTNSERGLGLPHTPDTGTQLSDQAGPVEQHDSVSAESQDLVSAGEGELSVGAHSAAAGASPAIDQHSGEEPGSGADAHTGAAQQQPQQPQQPQAADSVVAHTPDAAQLRSSSAAVQRDEGDQEPAVGATTTTTTVVAALGEKDGQVEGSQLETTAASPVQTPAQDEDVAVFEFGDDGEEPAVMTWDENAPLGEQVMLHLQRGTTGWREGSEGATEKKGKKRKSKRSKKSKKGKKGAGSARASGAGEEDNTARNGAGADDAQDAQGGTQAPNNNNTVAVQARVVGEEGGEEVTPRPKRLRLILSGGEKLVTPQRDSGHGSPEEQDAAQSPGGQGPGVDALPSETRTPTRPRRAAAAKAADSTSTSKKAGSSRRATTGSKRKRRAQSENGEESEEKTPLRIACSFAGCTVICQSDESMEFHVRMFHGPGSKPLPRAVEKGDFECPHEGCDRSYAYLRSLQSHCLTAHGVAPPRFPCPISGCGRVCNSRQSLKYHLENSLKHNPSKED